MLPGRDAPEGDVDGVYPDPGRCEAIEPLPLGMLGRELPECVIGR